MHATHCFLEYNREETCWEVVNNVPHGMQVVLGDGKTIVTLKAVGDRAPLSNPATLRLGPGVEAHFTLHVVGTTEAKQ